jgi:hypothetical protein
MKRLAAIWRSHLKCSEQRFKVRDEVMQADEIPFEVSDRPPHPLVLVTVVIVYIHALGPRGSCIAGQ